MEQFTGRILIVDDEPANVRLLERIVRDAGWAAARSTTDSREAAALHAELRSDLVLLDLMMPHLDGVAVMKQLRSTSADGEFLPIVILTADATGDAKRRALDAGATDFLTKPFDRVESSFASRISWKHGGSILSASSRSTRSRPRCANGQSGSCRVRRSPPWARCSPVSRTS